MLNKDQSQAVEAGAVAIQAAGNITIEQNGLSCSEVRAVALDVYKSNFYDLAGAAKDIARSRAEEVTDKFLAKLKAENPEGIKNAYDPDFQHGLFTIQKQYARSGDKDLGDLLVDLLVDRGRQQERSILQIVLNESLETAPKLTNQQLATLAILFLFRYTQNYGVISHATFGAYLDKHAERFIPMLVKGEASFQHLEFTGCGSSAHLMVTSLESIFAQVYRGLFFKGFEESEVASKGISVGIHPRVFVKCLNDNSKIQVRAGNREALDKILEELSVNADDRAKIVELFDGAIMNEQEIREKVIIIRPYMRDLFDIWSQSSMKSFSLTSVGMAIGHANIKRFIGEFAGLSIWIN